MNWISAYLLVSIALIVSVLHCGLRGGRFTLAGATRACRVALALAVLCIPATLVLNLAGVLNNRVLALVLVAATFVDLSYRSWRCEHDRRSAMARGTGTGTP